MGFLGPDIKKMKTNKDVEGLIEALKHKDLTVRRQAAEALGELGDDRAVEPLIGALKDKDTWLRWCAAEALGKIGDERAVKHLIEALKGERLGGSRVKRLGP